MVKGGAVVMGGDYSSTNGKSRGFRTGGRVDLGEKKKIGWKK